MMRSAKWIATILAAHTASGFLISSAAHRPVTSSARRLRTSSVSASIDDQSKRLAALQTGLDLRVQRRLDLMRGPQEPLPEEQRGLQMPVGPARTEERPNRARVPRLDDQRAAQIWPMLTKLLASPQRRPRRPRWR